MRSIEISAQETDDMINRCKSDFQATQPVSPPSVAAMAQILQIETDIADRDIKDKSSFSNIALHCSGLVCYSHDKLARKNTYLIMPTS